MKTLQITLGKPDAKERALKILKSGEGGQIVNDYEVLTELLKLVEEEGIELEAVRYNREPYPPSFFDHESVGKCISSKIEIRPLWDFKIPE